MVARTPVFAGGNWMSMEPSAKTSDIGPSTSMPPTMRALAPHARSHHRPSRLLTNHNTQIPKSEKSVYHHYTTSLCGAHHRISAHLQILSTTPGGRVGVSRCKSRGMAREDALHICLYRLKFRRSRRDVTSLSTPASIRGFSTEVGS